jgi:hypothetical protein
MIDLLVLCITTLPAVFHDATIPENFPVTPHFFLICAEAHWERLSYFVMSSGKNNPTLCFTTRIWLSSQMMRARAHEISFL